MNDDKLREVVECVRASGGFDADWYLREYPDVNVLGMDPALHYVRVGAALQRDPGPRFSTRLYLTRYPDIARTEVNPLYHYEQYGRAEGRAGGVADVIVPVAAESGWLPGPLAGAIHFSGRLTHRTGRPTVLVVAHVAGKHLFGGERSLLDLIAAFDALGYNVVATMPRGGNETYVEALRDLSTHLYEFDYQWWRRNIEPEQHVVAAFSEVMRLHAVDAVHVNTIMLREPLIAARRMGVRGVVHVRELIAHDAALLNTIGLSADDIVNQVLMRSDHIVANSRATGASFGVGKAVYLPNTVHLEELDIPLELDPQRIRVALISSNVPKKGIYEFAEVARRLADRVPNARFLLIGPDTEFSRHLQQQQTAGALPGNFEFAGYRATPLAAVRDADIVLNLSHFQESFGRTVLEAMAARRPVIAYDWGAVPELIEHGETGFLVPFGDVEACAQRVAQLCADPELLVEMGLAGRERAQIHYGTDRFAARLGRAYDRILSHASAPSKRLLLPRRQTSPAAAAGPLKIGYFLWHFPVPSETFVLNELRLLVERGVDVEVFCRRSPHPEFVPDFPVRWRQVESPEALADAIVETGRSVMHAHFTYPTVTEMLWPACQKARVPFTFIAHAQDIFRHANDEQNRIGAIGCSSMCLRVLVPSQFHADYVAERGVPREKIFINPNGIDLSLYPDQSVSRTSLRGQRSVCAIHRFTAKKNLAALIRAAGELAADGISIHLYGYGELEDEYRQLIEQEELGNVFLHGAVEGREPMLEVFTQHDLFACPSVRAADGDMDGIPTVLMEAMAAGLPVLATSVSGIPELVRHGETGFVCSPEPAQIAQAIRDFYARDEADIEAVVHNARALVADRYDATHLTQTLERLWRGDTLDLVIVSWNNLPQLREVVTRLCAHTQTPFHLIVCDNGSDADVTVLLNELYASRDDVTVVFNRQNAFVGPGTNICLEQGSSRYAVYVCGKEGFVLGPGWERPLLRYMDDNPDVGLAGTLCHAPSYLRGRQYPEAITLFPQFRNPGFAADNPERIFAHVQGGFFVMRREMVDAIGGFSDAVPHNYTDVEYSYYVESRGWRLGQVPGMLALYNKTRPAIFTRLDEHTLALHPPILQDLPLLDGLQSGRRRFCNVCDWSGAAFDTPSRCPQCGSLPADRTLLRCLAESKLTYRRLPALGIGVGEALQAFWKAQFQGSMFGAQELLAQLQHGGRSDHPDARLAVVYVDVVDAGEGDAWSRLLSEAVRVLSRDEGTLLVRAGSRDQQATIAGVQAWVANARPDLVMRTHRYASQVLEYDAHALLAFSTPPPAGESGSPMPA